MQPADRQHVVDAARRASARRAPAAPRRDRRRRSRAAPRAPTGSPPAPSIAAAHPACVAAAQRHARSTSAAPASPRRSRLRAVSSSSAPRARAALAAIGHRRVAQPARRRAPRRSPRPARRAPAAARSTARSPRRRCRAAPHRRAGRARSARGPCRSRRSTPRSSATTPTGGTTAAGHRARRRARPRPRQAAGATTATRAGEHARRPPRWPGEPASHAATAARRRRDRDARETAIRRGAARWSARRRAPRTGGRRSSMARVIGRSPRRLRARAEPIGLTARRRRFGRRRLPPGVRLSTMVQAHAPRLLGWNRRCHRGGARRRRAPARRAPARWSASSTCRRPPSARPVIAKGFVDRVENPLADIKKLNLAPYLVVALEGDGEGRRRAGAGQLGPRRRVVRAAGDRGAGRRRGRHQEPDQDRAHPRRRRGSQADRRPAQPDRHQVVPRDPAGDLHDRATRTRRTCTARSSWSRTQHVATVDDAGRFEMTDVPDGSYKLRVFYYDPAGEARGKPSDWLLTTDVTVAPRADRPDRGQREAAGARAAPPRRGRSDAGVLVQDLALPGRARRRRALTSRWSCRARRSARWSAARPTGCRPRAA